jgi:hypothetical protein
MGRFRQNKRFENVVNTGSISFQGKNLSFNWKNHQGRGRRICNKAYSEASIRTCVIKVFLGVCDSFF